ncbi:MAG TPA: N-acetyl-gamma-glutamyl-phosphate reductase [Persephonella sp.]|uniref:N-acetyl-gamma-glutamyl-phosphate reductase n=1 Tax=Persephonella marina (strain DSM 14350 / EX-H1) TaxID=123214 RepID=C0QU56_PERMH|nr:MULTISPECIES: N-acetyl-gamma-glutamyl-phosphate reductase [Persephonella]ACO04405.1 N-acetyl-gamma-glutamyl-phosphate reductase [Persephonella marina EX-H1]HCB70162.1 N-acetyl-gamma-glutamyl-phosphate reductase [Persephonella sp.]
MKIAIAGASGYTGIELLRILSSYEDIEINQISSRRYSGKRLKDVFPFFSGRFSDLVFQEDIDIQSSDFFFLCLPHEPSVELVKRVYESGKKVVDLSAAYRIKDTKAYTEFYGFEHKYPELLFKAVYGLPELFRDDIKNASVVANPGCYPTASILGLYPAVKEGVIKGEIVINALSGISGAGREPKQQFHYPEAFGDSYPYKPLMHRHIPEMENVLKNVSGSDIKVRFTPHIIPVSRGMIATITFRTDLSKDQIVELYRLEYRYEPFIRFLTEPPHTKYVSGSNFCDIFVDKDERTGLAVVITAIDNLGKGASSQAIQNFNIMTGREETYNLLTGIVYP